MKNRLYMIFSIIAVLCSYFIFGFTQFGAQAYATVFQKGNTYEEGTRVASLHIGGKSKEEAESLVTNAVNQWLTQSEVFLTYNDKKVSLPVENYTLKTEDTLTNLTIATENPIFVEVNREGLMDTILATSNSTLSKNIDVEKLIAVIQQSIGTLSKDLTFDLSSYIKTDEAAISTIASVSMPIGQLEKAVSKWVELVPKIKIKENSNISILDALGDQHVYFSSEELSTIVSYLYQVILPTNFEIIERQTSRELPTYAKLGYEVKVNQKEDMDFIFYNPNKLSYELDSSIEGNNLVIKLTGMPFIYTYQVVKENQQLFQPKEIVQFNGSLSQGQSKVISTGKVGQLVQMIRIELDETGVEVSKKVVSEDFYPPIPSVVQRSIIPEKSTEDTLTPDEEGGKEDSEDENSEDEDKEPSDDKDKDDKDDKDEDDKDDSSRK